MANPKGSWYSAYVWKFANARENATSFEDFVLEEYDLGFRIICIFFVVLGAGGMFLNGRKLFVFWRLKTVSTQRAHFKSSQKYILFKRNACYLMLTTIYSVVHPNNSITNDV